MIDWVALIGFHVDQHNVNSWLDCEQSLSCSKSAGEKFPSTSHARAAKPRVARVAGDERKKRLQWFHTTIVKLFDSSCLSQLRPFLNMIPCVFISRLRMICGWNGCLWKFIIFLQNKFWSQNKVWEEQNTANVTLYFSEEYLNAEVECVFYCERPTLWNYVFAASKQTEQSVQKLISRRISILWKRLNYLCKAWNM